MTYESIFLMPVGVVSSPIREPIDDVWGGITARIEIDATRFTSECLIGLEQFSHAEIIYLFDRVNEATVCVGARHPRGRRDWPLTGIFAQRAKDRPNRLGSTICRIVSITGLSIEVAGLDAIDGTPVLDIKPYFQEFAPRGEVRQPHWATELMQRYWA